MNQQFILTFDDLIMSTSVITLNADLIIALEMSSFSAVDLKSWTPALPAMIHIYPL